MSFRYRELEYYDKLPPWLRALIRQSEYSISAISVGEALRRLRITGREKEEAAAKEIISSLEDGMKRRSY